MADRANGMLLDTSVVIAHLRRQLNIMTLTSPSEPLFLPLIALGELYKGAEKSPRSEHNRKIVDDFLQIAVLLYPDITTAKIYARIAADLESKGQIIPENDIWIAGVALECDMPLATRDVHFQRVAGLTVIQW
jgi:tRNA(fMet)-specific endonuclease VapC